MFASGQVTYHLYQIEIGGLRERHYRGNQWSRTHWTYVAHEEEERYGRRVQEVVQEWEMIERQRWRYEVERRREVMVGHEQIREYYWMPN